MRNKRIYAFVIANHAASRVWRLSIPNRLLVLTGFLAVIGLAVAGAAGYHYGRMLLKVVDYDRILAENDDFRAENHSYRIKTAQLGEKVGFLEDLSHKLTQLAGIGKDGLGGIGGYSNNSFSRPRPGPSGELQSIVSYGQRVDKLEAQMQQAKYQLSEMAMIEAARPTIPPVNGYVTQGMGRRYDPFNPDLKEYHYGLDISAPYGTRVIAPADGTVIFAGPREGYGTMVIIDHRFGLTSRYGHLYKLNVRPGQHVSRYDVIGFVGNSGRSTGPHLHFEIWRNERAVNPIDYIYPEAREARNKTKIALSGR